MPWQPLTVILGHKWDQCRVPELSKESTDRQQIRTQWANDVFRKVLDCIFTSHASNLRSQIVFVDMLFSHVQTKEFFGAIVVPGDNGYNTYRNILKRLFAGGISVGSHPHFQAGLVEESTQDEGYLFSTLDKPSATHSCTATELSYHWIDAHSLLGELTPPKTMSDLLDEAAAKDVVLCWQKLCSELSNACLCSPGGEPLRSVAGIPITLPPVQTPSRAAGVASLFVGLAIENQDSAKATVGEIARRLVPYALRTYANQQVAYATKQTEHAAEQRKLAADATARVALYDRIRTDIQELTDQSTQLFDVALKIKREITPLSSSMFDHATLLRDYLFGDNHQLHYWYKEDGATTEVQLYEMDNYTVGEVKPAHWSPSVSKWVSIAAFLRRYGLSRRLDMLVMVGQCDNVTQESAQAMHALLKLLLHRPIAGGDENSLFDLQPLLAAAFCWSDKQYTSKKIQWKYSKNYTYVLFEPQKRLMFADFAGQLWASGRQVPYFDTEYVAPIHGHGAKVWLQAFMDLISRYLDVSGSGVSPRDTVTAQEVEVASEASKFTVKVVCNKLFEPSAYQKISSYSGSDSSHGLRGCLKRLSSALDNKASLTLSNDNGCASFLFTFTRTTQLPVKEEDSNG